MRNLARLASRLRQLAVEKALPHNGRIAIMSRPSIPLARLYTDGSMEIQFRALNRHQPFSQEATLREFRQRRMVIDGLRINDARLLHRPSIRANLLIDQKALDHLLCTLDWVIESLRRPPVDGTA